MWKYLSNCKCVFFLCNVLDMASDNSFQPYCERKLVTLSLIVPTYVCSFKQALSFMLCASINIIMTLIDKQMENYSVGKKRKKSVTIVFWWHSSSSSMAEASKWW